MTSEKDILTAKLFYAAAFPVIKVVLAENPKVRQKWEKINAVVQFRAKCDDNQDLVCHLVFDKAELTVNQGEFNGKPDLELKFNSVKKMVEMFKGKMTSLPDFSCLIKGVFTKPGLTVKTLMLLMELMLMMPSKQPDDELLKYLKVKMSLYMITTALSSANKLGWDGIKDWSKQPDRIYQFSVGDTQNPKLACYLRVKGGKSKAGRGIYARKTPFVHFHFLSVDGALNVLLKKREFVECVANKDLEVIGSPEYGVQINDIMSVLQDMLITL